MLSPPRLILASGSPRRRELLGSLGLDFQVRPVAVSEEILRSESPSDAVLRLADEKASARARPGELVLAADTLVVLDGDVLGKPTDAAEARTMLARLAGRRHTVHTGVALHDAGKRQAEHSLESTQVELAQLSPEEIDWYVGTGEPLDKAGAYAVQGLGAMFVETIEGNYSNVVGLPLPATFRLFRRLGYDLRDWGRS